MTTRKLLAALLPIAALTLLPGCVDDKYDLSNVDYSSRIDVKDLVVPVNLNPIKLNQIIDVKEDENIKEMEINGKNAYVFKNSGNFNSDPIHISSFHVNEATISSSTVRISTSDFAPAAKAPSVVPGQIKPLEYKFETKENSFNYNIVNVDNKVKSVISLETPSGKRNEYIEFSISLGLPNSLINSMSSIHLDNLTLQFPTGLTMADGKTPAEVLVDGKTGYGKYNPSNGLVTMSNYPVTEKSWDLTLRAQVVNIPKDEQNIEGGKFKYYGNIDVKSGLLLMTPKTLDFNTSYYDVTLDYTLGAFNIAKFTGNIDYKIDGLNFEDVKLNNLPKFLTQSGTDIKIANPQLYITIDNTCYEYGMKGETGLQITPMRENTPSVPLVLPAPIKVDDTKEVNRFIISPAGNDIPLLVSDYKGATPVSFPDFGNVLSGEGIPSTIKVAFASPDPRVYGEPAKKFPLQLPGQSKEEYEIPAVSGSYEFCAPLALSAGSKIFYSGTETEWNSDELKDLNVDRLELTTNVTSTIPLDVELTAYLMDEDGNHLGKVNSVTIPAGKDNVPVNFIITPADDEEYISNIDGIFYEVTAVSEESDPTPLSPDMTLTLKNIKAKINGFMLIKDDKDKDND